jgi:hypothetical protein
MIGMIVLSLLCLALASLVLRVVLFFLSKGTGRLARTTSITKSIGMLPVVAFEWACNLAMLGLLLLLLMLGYWVAPQRVRHLLGAN